VDNATVTDAGICYRLHQDGDLWLVPDGMEWDDDNEWFIWPESEEEMKTAADAWDGPGPGDD
jgi:hypothetical protein